VTIAIQVKRCDGTPNRSRAAGYNDRDKGDDWQGYAAIIAAAYTRALIESI